MSRRMRTYYYAVLGAIGGLVGWQVSNVLGLSFSRSIYLSDMLMGALLGLCLGIPLGAAEGLITLSPLRALRAGLYGGLVGLIAGGIGLPLGEAFFQVVGAGLFGRALGWGIFGTLLGLAESVTGRSQMWKGALGGALGGVIGGVLLESVRLWSDDLIVGKATGLVLLGAFIGALIALIVVLLSRAWLEVTSGKLKGTSFILDKFLREGGPTAIIGSSPLKSEIALPDPDVEPQHAMLSGAGSHFTLKDMSLGGTYLNNRKIERSQLVNGQTIRMGNTSMVYHERR
ncbi:MAG TPA: FHA domain-containing protein [Anaerolineae bacterium]|nr:FHA domain-containing protein [Anaerolineae bacterium]